MDRLVRPVWAEIDLDNIAFNMKNIKKLVKDKEVIAVIKADAYGHGAVEVAKVLSENGASRFAVAIITEAIELREHGIKLPIMILGYTPIEYAEDLIKYDIEQTVYNLEYAKQLSDIALKMGKKAKIHIALDTGMGRIGFMPYDNSLEEVLKISALDGIEIVGIFTHFSTADEEDKEYTKYQFDKIQNFIKKLSDKGVNIPLKHVSNSGAIIDLPETYLDAVRAGIILYGYYPSDEVKKKNLSIKPALTLKTKVAHIKKMEKDMYVSYGRTFKTERYSIIATLPIGYADG